MKLTAFLPVCKASLDMGPQWLDRFVRETLYEALASGLEVGIVVGTGNKMPIGMNRQVGDGVTVKGGVYPEKARVTVTDLSPDTVGNLLSLLAVDPNGKPRAVQDVLFIVNPQDYYQKVMPATTVMAPDGTYRNDVMPYPMKVIPSGALDRGAPSWGWATATLPPPAPTRQAASSTPTTISSWRTTGSTSSRPTPTARPRMTTPSSTWTSPACGPVCGGWSR